jgi:hypothetical protein
MVEIADLRLIYDRQNNQERHDTPAMGNDSSDA